MIRTVGLVDLGRGAGRPVARSKQELPSRDEVTSGYVGKRTAILFQVLLVANLVFFQLGNLR